jgi:hypothetical protein
MERGTSKKHVSCWKTISNISPPSLKMKLINDNGFGDKLWGQNHGDSNIYPILKYRLF